MQKTPNFAEFCRVIPLAVSLELSFVVVIRAEVFVDSNHVTEVQKFSSFGEILDWHKVIVKSLALCQGHFEIPLV